eukprot:CAMPEP_0184006792 /NCGR_PEP_ID=MMETSP0954-20121128/917_1 /TAXON_ID=627963 /ORGANISM="Aplanochytrium sp, Strain PBS07" /LENGTH=95 /DNA_ID=CAMNT_0026285435 /DNA_START=40 /DNA_END=324 /DNA_ORIENTATION=+
MAELCLSEKFISVDFSGNKVWHDEASKQLVLLKQNVYYTLDLSSEWELSRSMSPINFVPGGKVLDVKFSFSQRLVAIQRSDVNVDIVDTSRVAEW